MARIASVNAGSNLTFEYRAVPDVSAVSGGVSIDPNHKGPCAIYMKKVTDSSASNNAAGDGWFKIMEDGYDSVAGKWCTEKLIPNDGHLSATVPSDLAPGYYLVRPELLALHQADKTPPDPQFYVGCAQIFLNSSGSATPPNTVAIPGYVNMSTPGTSFPSLFSIASGYSSYSRGEEGGLNALCAPKIWLIMTDYPNQREC